MSSLPLEGRVAIVTGASRGIGRAIAIHLHSLGANLVLNYASSSAQAELLAAELGGPTRAVPVRADVSEPAQVKALFDQSSSAFPSSPLHILVHCAGVMDGTYPSIAATSVDTFDAIFNVNARGAFLCCREAANRLVRGGGGRIVTVSSSLTAALLPGYGAYAASKAAVEAMTRILAKEMKGTGVTANCVGPGPVATELFFQGKSEEDVRRLAGMSPMGRIGETGDVAPVVGFLCTDQGEWVNGQVIRVNGGFI